MNLPGPEHFLFIPGVLVVGIVLGWVLGSRAALQAIEEKRTRLRR